MKSSKSHLERSFISSQETKSARGSALDAPNINPLIQTKLTIGQPGDKYEQEADSMADYAVNKIASKGAPEIQRMGEEEEEELLQPKLKNTSRPSVQKMEEEEEMLQASSTHPLHADQQLGNQLQVSAGQGQSLASDKQAEMEAVFGADFSGVNIHTGADAVQMNQKLGAKAFTHGNDLYFNQGQYQPGTKGGDHLLAHELTHVVQQGSADIAPKIQCEWAIEPTVADPNIAPLTADEITTAQRYNSTLFTDANEIGEVRDVLGVSREPSVVDQDFIEAVQRYQASFGQDQDGMLGSRTAGVLAREITAEADSLGDAATGTLRRTVARRLLLRSQVQRRRGRIEHQGFTGPEANPGGVVTARLGGSETGMNAALTNSITLDYTGRGADNTHWLQFVSPVMYGTQPGSDVRRYNTGAIGGHAVTWSTNTVTNWSVDSLSAASPFYDTAGANTRRPGRSILIADQPQGWQPIATSFAATLAPAANRVRMNMHFISYAIVNNRPAYFVEWHASYRFNITTGTQSDIVYWIGRTGTTSRLRTAHRASVDARNPGNGIL